MLLLEILGPVQYAGKIWKRNFIFQTPALHCSLEGKWQNPGKEVWNRSFSQTMIITIIVRLSKINGDFCIFSFLRTGNVLKTIFVIKKKL